MPSHQTRMSIFLPLLSLTIMNSHGCGGSANGPDYVETTAPRLTAATIGEQTVQSNAEYLASPTYVAADASLGQRLAMPCRACHSLEKGGINMIGPNLHGFLGRQAGSVKSFAYSEALAEASFVWTPQTLDAWLAQPATFLPGNRMIFAGLRSSQDRDALIAFLLRVLDDEADGLQQEE